MSDTSVHITEMDQISCDSTAQLLKAALPYTNASAACALTIAAKFLELKKALAYLKKPQSDVSVCSVSGQHATPEEMLKDLRKYCNQSQTEMIDRMLNIMQMGKFYEKYKELENSPEFATMMSMFKAMSAGANTSTNASGYAQAQDSPPQASAMPSGFETSMENASQILGMLMQQSNATK